MDLPDCEEHPPALLVSARRISPPESFDLPEPNSSRDIFTQINERFKKTLSLDSRPQSMVSPSSAKKKKPKFRPKSFFSIEAFLDSRRSDCSSADDFHSSKYRKFDLDSENSSPLFGTPPPDLLNIPVINNAASESTKKRLDKLENHFNKIQRLKKQKEDVYIEPISSSRSTLPIGADSRDNSIDSSHDLPVLRRDKVRKAPEQRISQYEVHVTEDDLSLKVKAAELTVKTMDKSVDSIGSCSLDVEADNTDLSDTTSGSLNILTPSSTASHYRDFTSRLQERVNHQQSAHLKVPSAAELLKVPSIVVQRSKPSYLHLACSVNGYSNITTYDSKLRQKLNKSREASPGRPGNALEMLRDCTNDAMAQRFNIDQSSPFFKTSFSETSISSQNVLTFSNSNRNPDGAQASKSYQKISNGTPDTHSPTKSFIQQRVERLYGPGALAQGFFNQKRTTRTFTTNGSKSPESRITTHQIISRTQNGVTSESTVFSSSSEENGDAALPVLRHLRPEFRAQLPILSPKRSIPFRSTETSPIGVDVVDRAKCRVSEEIDDRTKPQPVVKIIPIQREADEVEPVISLDNNCNNVSFKDLEGSARDTNVEPIEIVREEEKPPSAPLEEVQVKTNGHQVQDGHYFLSLKQAETNRLIKLAEMAEEELEKLLASDTPCNEEVLGLLRSASGKARLLATQKMQQFEGLCLKNINVVEGEAFPTTSEDLRGFWDMVSLQVEDISKLYAQIEASRAAGWKEVPAQSSKVQEATSQPTPRSTNKKLVTKTPQTSEKAAAMAKKREEQRKAMLEARKQLRMAAAANAAKENEQVEIFTPPSTSSKPS